MPLPIIPSVPTFDWVGFIQRISKWIWATLVVHTFLKVFGVLFNLFKTPMFLVATYVALVYFPDACQWIFLKIGEIEVKAFMVLVNACLPDMFPFGSEDVATWKNIWEIGLNTLPTEIVEVMNATGIGEMLGLVSTTLTACGCIIAYRKIMMRAGLL